MEKLIRIQPNNVELVCSRFYNFDDGVVNGVHLLTEAYPRTCTVDVQCADREAVSGWSTLRLTIRAMMECRFELGKKTYGVLSGGIQFAWRNQSIYVILDAYPDDDELPDLRTNIAYVAGESCDLEWLGEAR